MAGGALWPQHRPHPSDRVLNDPDRPVGCTKVGEGIDHELRRRRDLVGSFEGVGKGAGTQGPAQLGIRLITEAMDRAGVSGFRTAAEVARTAMQVYPRTLHEEIVQFEDHRDAETVCDLDVTGRMMEKMGAQDDVGLQLDQ